MKQLLGYVLWDSVRDLYYNRVDRTLKPLKQTTAIYKTVGEAKRGLSQAVSNIRRYYYKKETGSTTTYFTKIKFFELELDLKIRPLYFELGEVEIIN